MAGVDVFGTVHIDRPNKVREELSEFSESAEIFFIESPREVDSSDLGNLLRRNPALWITSWILHVVWGLPGFLLTRNFESIDSSVTREVAESRNLDIEPVDLNLMRRASDVNRYVTGLSWFWVCLIPIVVTYGFMTSPIFLGPVSFGPVFFAGLAVLMGFLPIAPFAHFTLEERDEETVENIENLLSERDDVQKGCLIVGHKHMDGIVEELEESTVTVGEKHRSKFLRKSQER